MALTMTRGQTFGSSEEVTNTKLHNLIDGATGADIDRTNFQSDTTAITNKTSAPSGLATNEVWADTSATPPIYNRYDGSNSKSLLNTVTVDLTNKSGGQVIAGDLVVVDTTTDESFTTTTTASSTGVLGVALETIADDAVGKIAISGVHEVNIGSAATRGQFIQTSTTVKEAQVSTDPAEGSIGMVVEALGASGLGKCVLFSGPIAGGVPTGTVFSWTTDTAPTGYLLCDGSSVSTTTYAALHAVIGYVYGGSGANFNVPDMRGRVPLGQDDMGGSSANRVTNAQADSLGGNAGAETHTLTTAEMPSHTHAQDADTVLGSAGASALSGGTGTQRGGTTGSAGSGNAHNNMQPYLTLNYIIKT